MLWFTFALATVLFAADADTVFQEISHEIIELQSCSDSDNFPDEASRIAGKDRTRAPPNSWPWIVRLQFFGPRGVEYCDGTIIGKDKILTGIISILRDECSITSFTQCV